MSDPMDMSDAPRTTPEDDGKDIAKANRKGRALLVAAIVFAMALIAAFQFYALPLLNSTASATSEPNTFVAAKALFVAVAGLAAMTAFVWICYARQILRHRQDPPPGAWLWRDTKVVHGAAATRRAWLSIAAALLMCAACVGVAFYIGVLLDRRAGFMPHRGDETIPRTSPAPIKPAVPQVPEHSAR